MVSIMTALWFAHLEAEDRVSVKPHASPVLQAIQYLLGNLDRSYLTKLRAYEGLQSYPSRSSERSVVYALLIVFGMMPMLCVGPLFGRFLTRKRRCNWRFSTPKTSRCQAGPSGRGRVDRIQIMSSPSRVRRSR